GVDVLTDGEWRREGYFQVFYERVEGFAPDLIPGRTRKWPAAVAPLRRQGPIVAGGIAFLRKLTDRAIKLTLPSAYVILRRFYSPEHSAHVYPTREHFLRAVEEVLIKEASDALAAGADCVQLDDPMLGYFVDPKYREQRSGHWGTGQFMDVETELRLGVDSASRLAGPLRQRGAHVVLHVCRGNIERGSDAEGDFEGIWHALARAEVDELALEFAMPQAGGLDVLARFPEGVRLGLGCGDVRCPGPEGVEAAGALVRPAALQRARSGTGLEVIPGKLAPTLLMPCGSCGRLLEQTRKPPGRERTEHSVAQRCAPRSCGRTALLLCEGTSQTPL